MTVNELIENLKDLRERGYGETEVKITYQPNYPMEESVSDVVGFNGHTDEDGEEKDRDACVYLTGSECNDYAPRRVFESCGHDTIDGEDYVPYIEEDEYE